MVDIISNSNENERYLPFTLGHYCSYFINKVYLKLTLLAILLVLLNTTIFFKILFTRISLNLSMIKNSLFVILLDLWMKFEVY